MAVLGTMSSISKVGDQDMKSVVSRSGDSIAVVLSSGGDIITARLDANGEVEVLVKRENEDAQRIQLPKKEVTNASG